MCIGDNASFSSGGGNTLVGTNHAHVHVQCMAKKF